METVSLELSDYPKFDRWYTEHAAHSPLTRPAAKFVYSIAQSLSRAAEDVPRAWLIALTQLGDTAEDLSDEWRTVEAALAEFDFPLAEVQAHVFAVAIQQDLGDRCFRVLSELADKSTLASFRFLSAWSALNCGELQRCIDECEKVDTPFSPLLTLQGQAYLESGQPAAAAEALRVATQLNPGELLAWFQLAKAELVLGHRDEAWSAVSHCLKIAPGQGEVALLASMIGLMGQPDRAISQHAWNSLFPFVAQFGDHEEVVLSLLKLAIQLDDAEKALGVAPHAKWESLKANPQFIRGLTSVLHKLNEKNWFHVAERILTGLTTR